VNWGDIWYFKWRIEIFCNYSFVAKRGLRRESAVRVRRGRFLGVFGRCASRGKMAFAEAV